MFLVPLLCWCSKYMLLCSLGNLTGWQARGSQPGESWGGCGGQGEFRISTKAQRQEKRWHVGEKRKSFDESWQMRRGRDGESDWILRVLGRHGRVLAGCAMIRCPFCKIILNIARDLFVVWIHSCKRHQVPTMFQALTQMLGLQERIN